MYTKKTGQNTSVKLHRLGTINQVLNAKTTTFEVFEMRYLSVLREIRGAQES